MDDFIKRMAAKAGIDQGTAEKAAGVLKENPEQIPAALAGNAEALTPLLAKAGISEGVSQKVVAFLKDHTADVQAWMTEHGGEILGKAKGALGGLFGGKKS